MSTFLCVFKYFAINPTWFQWCAGFVFLVLLEFCLGIPSRFAFSYFFLCLKEVWVKENVGTNNSFLKSHGVANERKFQASSIQKHEFNSFYNPCVLGAQWFIEQPINENQMVGNKWKEIEMHYAINTALVVWSNSKRKEILANTANTHYAI